EARGRHARAVSGADEMRSYSMSVVRNPVLMLAWGLPAVAVLASVASLMLTLHSPESELPEQYHWEGFQLDRDFSQAARATELKVHATLSGFGASGQCEL